MQKSRMQEAQFELAKPKGWLLESNELYDIVLQWAERIGPLSSKPSTIDIFPRLHQEPAMHLLSSNVLPPNSGLTQYECGRMKPLLCAKQSSQVSSGQNLRRLKQNINHNIHICITLANKFKSYRYQPKCRGLQNIGIRRRLKYRRRLKFRHWQKNKLQQNIGAG
jgi:hypothetical protein